MLHLGAEAAISFSGEARWRRDLEDAAAAGASLASAGRRTSSAAGLPDAKLAGRTVRPEAITSAAFSSASSTSNAGGSSPASAAAVRSRSVHSRSVFS
jgi:hypothetical protein